MPRLVPNNDPYDKEDSAPKSPEELSSAENQPAGREGAFSRERDKLDNLQRLAGDIQDIVGKGFTAVPAGKLGAAQKVVQALWGTKKRKNGTVAGGVTGLILTLTMVGGTFVSGPLEFVHLSQLLTEGLMTQNEETTDNWMSKAFRRARGASLDQLRVGHVTSKWLTSVDKKLVAAGFTPTYTENFRLGTGYDVDINKAYALNPENPMDLEVARQKLATEFGVDLNRQPNLIQIDGNKIRIAAEVGEMRHGTINKFNRTLMKRVGYSRLVGPMSAWLTSKRAGSVSALHPIKKIDQAILKNVDMRLTKWREDRAKTIQGGDATTRTPSTNDESRQYDANGKPIEDEVLAQETRDKANGVREVNEVVESTDVKKPGVLTRVIDTPAFKIGGGTTAIIGLICLANSMANTYDEMYFDGIVTPLKNIYQEWVSLGEQIKAGVALAQTDLTWEQIGDYVLLMRKKVEAKGEESTTETDTEAARRLALQDMEEKEYEDNFWDAPPIAQANGVTAMAGTVVPAELTNVGEKNVILELFGNNTVTNVCKPVNSWVGTIVMGAIDIASGPVSGAIGLVAGMALGPKLITWVLGAMLGKMVDEQNAGIAMGYYAWHGGEYLSNEMGLMKSGRELTAQEQGEWSNHIAQLNTERFQEKSFAQRVLNPLERRSLAGRTIHNIDPSIRANLSNFASGFLNISKSFSTIGSNIFGFGSASAAGVVTYDSGIPNYGYSLSELGDDTLDVFNPDNSAAVVDVVNTAMSTSMPDIKSKLEECTGNKIVHDSEGAWAVWAGAEGGVNPYRASYEDLGCADGNGTTDLHTWNLLRNWIGATISMDQALCYETGDQEACQFGGFGGEPASANQETSETGGNPSVASGGYTWPSPGYRITSPYNQFRPQYNSIHHGIDIDQGGTVSNGGVVPGTATPAVALHDGTITGIYGEGNCPYTMTGSCVQLSWIDATTGETFDAYYNHQAALVTLDQQVTAGTAISEYNHTGTTTGSHLHLEMFVNGNAVDPTKYIGSAP